MEAFQEYTTEYFDAEIFFIVPFFFLVRLMLRRNLNLLTIYQRVVRRRLRNSYNCLLSRVLRQSAKYCQVRILLIAGSNIDVSLPSHSRSKV